MATTYELIASQTLGSSAASVTFSAIPGTYTDLLAVLSVRMDTNIGPSNQFDTDLYLRPNGSTTNLSSRVLYGNGSFVGSGSPSTIRGSITLPRATSNTFASNEFYIPNYAGSTNKSVSVTAVNESNNANDVYAQLTAGLWSSTAAITSLEFVPYTGSFVSGSSFYLYGITKA